MGEKYWRGWFAREEVADPPSPIYGVDPWDKKKICCNKPFRKCIDIESPNVAIRSSPFLLVPSAPFEPQCDPDGLPANDAGKRRVSCSSKNFQSEFLCPADVEK